MARVSTHTDQKLIRAARELLPETGFSRLTLRAVAARAGVNLGMFHYHYANKRAFVQGVLEATYGEFLDRFNLTIAEGGSDREKLRNALRALAYFARDHRQLLASLARDIMEGDRDCLRFVERNFHRHVLTILGLLAACRKSGVLDKKVPLPVMISFIAAAIAAPSVVFGVLERARAGAVIGSLRRAMAPQVIGDRAVEMRIDRALRAMAPIPGIPGRPPAHPRARGGALAASRRPT